MIWVFQDEKGRKKISRSLLAKTREIYVLYLRKILMGRSCRGHRLEWMKL